MSINKFAPSTVQQSGARRSRRKCLVWLGTSVHLALNTRCVLTCADAIENRHNAAGKVFFLTQLSDLSCALNMPLPRCLSYLLRAKTLIRKKTFLNQP